MPFNRDIYPSNESVWYLSRLFSILEICYFSSCLFLTTWTLHDQIWEFLFIWKSDSIWKRKRSWDEWSSPHDSFLRYGSSKFFLVLSLLFNDCLKIKSPKFLKFSFLLTHIWERRGRYERIYYLSRMNGRPMIISRDIVFQSLDPNFGPWGYYSKIKKILANFRYHISYERGRDYNVNCSETWAAWWWLPEIQFSKVWDFDLEFWSLGVFFKN